MQFVELRREVEAPHLAALARATPLHHETIERVPSDRRRRPHEVHTIVAATVDAGDRRGPKAAGAHNDAPLSRRAIRESVRSINAFTTDIGAPFVSLPMSVPDGGLTVEPLFFAGGLSWLFDALAACGRTFVIALAVRDRSLAGDQPSVGDHVPEFPVQRGVDPQPPFAVRFGE